MKYIVKGNFADTPTKDEIRIRKLKLIINDGVIESLYDMDKEIENEDSYEIYDYSDSIILPGLIDIHMHAPQYSYSGTAMDKELLSWLDDYTFPEEARYKDKEYAKKNYKILVNDMVNSPSTRFVIFDSIFKDSTIELMNQLEENKLISYVGKLNMDRNSPDYYKEKDALYGYGETVKWLDEVERKNYTYIKPIITPRFTPSVTDEYMKLIGKLAKKKHIAVQSHLDENIDEIKWVKELCPDSIDYADTYDRFDMFGSVSKCVMAHCIYPNEREKKLIKDRNVFIAHCPTSNSNVIAGICPVREYLDNGFNIGLGSDVAGGHTLNLFECMVLSIQLSKIYWKFIDNAKKPIGLNEALYMATYGGGKFFGNVGLFEKGYEFDSIVLDESKIKNLRNFDLLERIERYTYLGQGEIKAKFVRGNKIK